MKGIERRVQDDVETIERIIAGDGSAFENILERYGGLVRSTVRRHVPPDHVEDTMQEVFLRAYRSLPGFKHQSGVAQWLSVIAVRACYDFWREHFKSREVAMSSLSAEQEAWLSRALSDESEQSLCELSLRKEAAEILDRALAGLSAGDRMVLELVYLEDRPLKEAADLMGWSRANVKVRLFRARRKLHKLLTGSGRDDAMMIPGIKTVPL